MKSLAAALACAVVTMLPTGCSHAPKQIAPPSSELIADPEVGRLVATVTSLLGDSRASVEELLGHENVSLNLPPWERALPGFYGLTLPGTAFVKSAPKEITIVVKYGDNDRVAGVSVLLERFPPEMLTLTDSGVETAPAGPEECRQAVQVLKALVEHLKRRRMPNQSLQPTRLPPDEFGKST